LLLEEQVQIRAADAELSGRPNKLAGRVRELKKASEMNYLTRQFAIAPMMEWTD
jgi:hypothetical protein